ncbi:MAG: arginine--tRNA ligase, partial [Actinobacteria bacterium]|nr:arginine--tRNA ligase [Actinomycetota bacterium]
MADPLLTLRPRLAAAIESAFGAEYAGTDPVLRRSDKADYQANAAMALAKRVGQSPRDIAQAIVDHADLAGVVASTEVAGPGFINLTLDSAFLASCVADETAPRAEHPETVVVDYSAPNVAKEMHVGHLRSTIIGDALVRVLEAQGNTVIRQNHIGDWGTQFGMLIEHLLDLDWESSADHSIADLNALYQQAQTKFRSDEAFAERARRRVVLLQAGDEQTLAIWRDLVAESERHFELIYERLGVRLTPADICAESFFNPVLDEVAAELEAKGLARIDDGALCVFPPGFTGREGEPLPLIVRKSDGGYGYQATDLAAVRYRTRDLDGTRLIYVVGAPQAQHLAMVIAVAKEAGWLDEGRRAEHVAFGSILGEDRKPYKTRSGENIKLIDLLDEAVERASAEVAEKNPDLDPGTAADVARQIGIGAVKYADLANDRVKDYVFDWDRMLSFDGNTAPYLQYAHARIRSIFRRAEADGADAGAVAITEPAERALALQLI